MILTFNQLGKYGRLGNQMFQYATLRALGVKLNIPVKIPGGNYDLLRFNIKKDFDNSININKYDEKCFNFSEDIFNIKDNTDIFGYFQSYKYFDFIKDVLLNEFKCNNLEQICDNIINKIKQKYNNKKITSVHIRRGDYLKYPLIHPVCTLEYYKNCIESINDSVFVVFSDDIKWCIENIKFDNAIFEYVFYDQIVDFILMSKCDNNIICNSSFSWWAAYLNKNEDKIIKYPHIWFGQDGPHDLQDMFPESWSKV